MPPMSKVDLLATIRREDSPLSQQRGPLPAQRAGHVRRGPQSGEADRAGRQSVPGQRVRSCLYSVGEGKRAADLRSVLGLYLSTGPAGRRPIGDRDRRSAGGEGTQRGTPVERTLTWLTLRKRGRSILDSLAALPGRDEPTLFTCHAEHVIIETNSTPPMPGPATAPTGPAAAATHSTTWSPSKASPTRPARSPYE
jgi:hypothetical protein